MFWFWFKKKKIEIPESDRYVNTVLIAQQLDMMNGCHTSLSKKKKKTKWTEFLTANHCWIPLISICFWSGCLVLMKSRSITTTSSESGRDWIVVSQQTVVKPGLTVRKVLLCLWWDLGWKDLANMREIVFHQDNDRLNTSIGTQSKIREIRW